MYFLINVSVEIGEVAHQSIFGFETKTILAFAWANCMLHAATCDMTRGAAASS